MKSEITISELAKLMNVSVHQIRYFEEKEVLMPSYTGDNQYRMYGIEQIYQLAHILLLRKLGLSVQSIKECMTSFGPEQVRQVLQTSLAETNAEILRLQSLQRFISKVLHEHKDFSQENTAYQVKWREPVNLMFWFEMSSQSTLHARELAGQAGQIANLFETDIHFVYDGAGNVSLYTEVREQGSRVLPAGEYLISQFAIEHEAELDRQIARFYDYAAAQSYAVTGPLVLIEKSYLSLFSQDKLHYELLLQLEAGVPAEEGSAP
ncbi:MerR family transcriptional regulator [Paenibacillus sp. HW567]|uniref:MerR family transcriptional regulator n=1 Tax=Paenibacillus sp. HW567 TaxID=1034769 RepID=UPI000371389D|nr:MerR family transcriptional regulator [Paenibacillus sp. HW567]